MALNTTVPWRPLVDTLAGQIVTLVIANNPTMSWKDTQNALSLANHRLLLRSRTLSQVLPDPPPGP